MHGSHRGGDTLGPLHCLLSDNPGKLDMLTEPAGQPRLSLLRCAVVIGIFCIWVLPLPAPSLDLARPVRRAASSDPQRIDSDNATTVEWPRCGPGPCSRLPASKSCCVMVVVSTPDWPGFLPHSPALSGGSFLTLHCSLGSAQSELITIIYLEPSVAIFSSSGLGLIGRPASNVTEYPPTLGTSLRMGR